METPKGTDMAKTSITGVDKDSYGMTGGRDSRLRAHHDVLRVEADMNFNSSVIGEVGRDKQVYSLNSRIDI